MNGPQDPRLPFLGLGNEQALEAMAEALPDGMFVTDLEGHITYWNRAAERITGYSRDDALGRSCALFTGDIESGCLCGTGPLRCGVAAQGKSTKSCIMRKRDGRAIPIVKNALPLYSPDGECIGAIENFTEVPLRGAPPPAGACPDGAGDLCRLVGAHPAMVSLFRVVQLVARSNATVMVLGESGTGKELVAEAIHKMSPRSRGPFVRVSCSALNESLLESELFGHVKGAFTGAVRDRRGRFEEADKGTLLLDEIGDVSPVVQVKLLRVIQQREVERVGDSSPVPVDVRLVCATHRDLKALVAEGKFRADLYFRLNVFPVRVPPLRERIDDLPRLAAHLLLAHGSPPLATGALEVLSAYHWPGNVRELENVLEYASLRAEGGEIRSEHLPDELHLGPRVPHQGSGRHDADAIRAALEGAGWNRAAAARKLGISRVTLWKKMKRFGIAEAGAGPGSGEEPDAGA